MNLTFFETEPWEEEYIKQNLKNHKITFIKDEISEKTAELAKDSEIISVFIYSRIDKQILSKLPKLKAIATRSTGFDHINTKACKARNIMVSNVPTYGENTVAEHTFALILALSRKICKSYDRAVRGNFSLEGLRGFDLKGKTIGIIGLGHIGNHVARIAKGFEMKILALDNHKSQNLAKKLGLKFTYLENLLKSSDIVTLHVPYNKATHHLINEKTIKLMKKGSIIINTSRGGIIETGALVKALSNKKIGGAGLDVLEEESLIKEEAQLLSKNFSKEKLENLIENHMLLTFENVIITPHNAFNSKEALQRILGTTIENIKCVTKGKCENIVK